MQSNQRPVKPANTWRWAILPVFLYALLFPVLAFDVVGRLLAHAAIQDKGNLALLLFFELTRAIRCLIDLSVVAWLTLRMPERRDARALAWFLLFGVITYAIAFTGGGYVGPLQEWLTRHLLALGASKLTLTVMFGYPVWPAWLALPGLVRFGVLFPKPLSIAEVDASGVADRAGLLRGVPGAGVDIGGAFRRLLAGALRRGWLDAMPLWIASIIGALLSLVLRGTAGQPVLWVGYSVFIATAITGFRAQYVTGDADARRRVRWIARGATVGVVLFVFSGLVGLKSGTAADVVVFILLTLAPVALLLGFGVAIFARARTASAPAQHEVRAGGLV